MIYIIHMYVIKNEHLTFALPNWHAIWLDLFLNIIASQNINVLPFAQQPKFSSAKDHVSM